MVVTCDVSFTPAEIPANLRDAAVVVIDVLRATTTIAHALESGARCVVPCEEPADALAVRERRGVEDTVLGGERNSVRISGFDLDNSPQSYVREIVQGKTVAFTTTNGTRALRRAMEASPRAILCGAFVNLGAVVEQLLEQKTQSLLLACAGDEGSVALEDVLLAGAIAQRLQAAAHVRLTDAAKAALLAYEGAAHDLPGNIARSAHAEELERAGFSADIRLAAKIDEVKLVPTLRDGEIIR
jgi:2-phosphosulfolactate phosphatase